MLDVVVKTKKSFFFFGILRKKSQNEKSMRKGERFGL